ncbi:hypothetical protein CGRA01v4_03771 [Colletotrichum graminicola]|nr:hypothetical protein CGRA01v4_03771 [Colletotrichum graminicola]
MANAFMLPQTPGASCSSCLPTHDADGRHIDGPRNRAGNDLAHALHPSVEVEEGLNRVGPLGMSGWYPPAKSRRTKKERKVTNIGLIGLL